MNATTISPGVSTVMGPEATPMGPGIYTVNFGGVSDSGRGTVGI